MSLQIDGKPMTLEQRLGRYRASVKNAVRWRDGEGYDELWEGMYALYEGDHCPKDTGQDEIAVNLCWSTVNIIMASTVVRYPKIAVSPRRPDASLAAELVSAVVNHDFRVGNFMHHIRRAVKDSVIMGHGIVKTVWRFDRTSDLEVENSLDDDESTPKWKDKLKAQVNAVTMPGWGMVTPPGNAELEQMAMEHGYAVVQDTPVVKYVSPFDVFFDPLARSFDDARWVAQRSLLTRAQLRSRDGWPPTARKEATASAMDLVHMRRDNITANNAWNVDENDEIVTIWEFYDLETGEMCQFAEDGGHTFLTSPRTIPFAFGQPFTIIVNQDNPRRLYPLGELQQIETLQKELNEVRRRLLEAGKQFTAKFAMYDSVASQRNIAALKSSEPGEVIIIEDQNIPLTNALRQLDSKPIEAEAYQIGGVLRQDIYEVTAVSEFQRGGGAGISTATEASIVNDAAQARVAEKLGNIEFFMRTIAEKVVMLYQQFLTSEKIVRLQAKGFGDEVTSVGMIQNEHLFLQISRSMIAGQFDFEIEAGSSTPNNPTQKKQTAQQMIAVLAPFAMQFGIDMRAVLMHVLEDGFDVRDASRFFAPQTPPQAPLTGPDGAPLPDSAPGGVVAPNGLQPPLQPTPAQAV